MAFLETEAPILDTFSRGDGPLGADWLPFPDMLSELAISTQQVVNPAAPDASGGNLWHDELGPCCAARITVVQRPVTQNGYVQLHTNADPVTGDSYSLQIVRDDGGGDSLMMISDLGGTPFTIDFQDGDSFAMKILNTGWECYQKPAGGAWALVGSVSGTPSRPAGNPGIVVDSGIIDDFGAGTITEEEPPPAPPDPTVGDIATLTPGALMEGLTLRLLAGTNPRNPKRILDLSGSDINLHRQGFAPGVGKENVIWSGKSARFDGQRRVSSQRDNADPSITYTLADKTSAVELRELQQQVERFLLDCGHYEEEQRGIPVWLEYRWSDGLKELPTPVRGYLSSYLRVRWGTVPDWPKNLHTGLPAGVIEGIVANLVCDPIPYGLPDAAGWALGGVTIEPEGICLPNALTNNFANPSFGHPTDWDFGWTASDASLLVLQETRDGLTCTRGNAARLVNGTSDPQQLTQSLTFADTNNRAIACLARRMDGGEIDDTYLELYGNGAVIETTHYVAIRGGPWYLCWGRVIPYVGAADYGVEVKAGHEVIVDNLQLDNESTVMPDPFCDGWMLGCHWDDTAYESAGVRGTGARVTWRLANELAGQFTIDGWVTFTHPYGNPLTGDVGVCEYYVFGEVTNRFTIRWSETNTRFEVVGVRGGIAFTLNGATRPAFDMFTTFHVALVQGRGYLALYVNGALDAAIWLDEGGFGTAGLLGIGSCFYAGATSGIFDGWGRIWDIPLSGVQIEAIYANELSVKQQHRAVRPVIFDWTEPDGAGWTINHMDEGDENGAHNNYHVLGGAIGAPADVRWEILLPASDPTRTWWLSRLALEEPTNPAGLTWLDLSGEEAEGCSGGEYQEATVNANSAAQIDIAIAHPELIRGPVRVLAHMSVMGDGEENLLVTPYTVLGSPGYQFTGRQTAISPTLTASFKLRDLGELQVNWEGEEHPATGLTLTLFFSNPDMVEGATVGVDFVLLLMPTACRAQVSYGGNPSVSQGDKLIIDGLLARIEKSDGQYLYHCELAGQGPSLEPYQYNYVTIVYGEDGAAFDISITAPGVAIVTPHCLLPGGPA
jgi:hypothetical protein